MSTLISAPAAAQSGLAPHGNVEAVYARITRRLIPFLFICYLLNFIDRANIGFAQLQMKTSLGFSDAVYGLGAAMFFVGYVLFEVPSNMLLQRIGARLTIMRIMLLWGLASSATLLVTTPTQFYLVRFLLGVFEAGFFPGIVLYLTFWYPPQRRARVLALFCMAQVAAAFITSPVSGWILKNMHGLHGWEGWQWMFFIEGMPTVLLGLLVLWLLPNGPQDAKWLSADERELLRQGLQGAASDGEASGGHGKGALAAVLRDPRIYLLAFGAFVSGCAGYFLAFWTPTIIRELGVADLQLVGLYAVVPNVFALFAMFWYGRRSDRRNEQRLHWTAAFMAASAGFLLLAWAIGNGSLAWTLVAITAGGSALVAATPVFWAMVTRYLERERAAVGIALVNTLASVAGISPAVVGAIKARTGSLDDAIYLLCALFMIAALAMALGMRKALANSGRPA
ncbi:Sugar phosphate permease [Pseudomonas delhiensis]|uniref:Sugar phosphate permease n=1 Tax=Pseudomonas delhiensis TaxID=366289 RepID=A0A239N1B8_9PSED|nr:MFS transporter [Pseudomonas delhiensis]SDK45164.1 Sugar phosphate permease [Pseudomonas delhiensis]SNT48273.1 Sugar phosphate permease [Pseudomonas delhiensis]